MKDEIGLEEEVWLLDRENKIIEPAIYSFPHDDFGFLIEIRTLPHTESKPILEDLEKLTRAFQYQAKLFNFRIVEKSRMPIDRKLIEKLRIKYNYFNLGDITENTQSGGWRTHATGIMGETLSAGLHVHFSRKKENGMRIQLPIRRIVDDMDSYFKAYIEENERIKGEYEIKPYGFEYRSLPATVPKKEVVNYGFSLLRKYRKK